MKNVSLTFVAALLLVCNSAIADQCAYIGADVRDAVYSILKSTDSYVDFCAPCQDTEPIKYKIKKLDYKQVDYKDGYPLYEIYINNKPVDIAYIYVAGRNLAMQANCKPFGEEVQRVPEHIDDYLTGKWTLPSEREPE
ncbi:MAG: hypothetical protein LBJ73_05435 [Rickettsiales bacterium]|jgi:hypothetical protein|nr:hypothetical protein [Rickettsiales bacterium]